MPQKSSWLAIDISSPILFSQANSCDIKVVRASSHNRVPVSLRRKLRQGKLSISVVVAAVTSTFFTSICVHTWSRTGDSHCLCSRGHILSAFQCTLDRFLRVPSNPQASLRLRRRRYLFVRRLVVWMGIAGLEVACRMKDQSMLAAPAGNNDVALGC